jgi:hypothetical protein
MAITSRLFRVAICDALVFPSKEATGAVNFNPVNVLRKTLTRG